MTDETTDAALFAAFYPDHDRSPNLAGPRYRSTLSAYLDRTGRMDKWFIEQMGCSQALFYAIERGDRFPTQMYRRLAAQVLGVPEEELFVPLPATPTEDEAMAATVRDLLAR